MNGFAPGLMDRLFGGRGHADSIVQLKDAVARDLEDLLNTRAAAMEAAAGVFPECVGSIVNYGLIDFAGLCLSSSEDRARICASLKATIERHEPRLRQVQARIELRSGIVNRVDFIISGVLAVFPVFEPINFDAVLQPSTLHYSIHHSAIGAQA